MPFTAVHFGIALPIHAVTRQHQFSLWAFTATQILIDLEPGVKLVAGYEGDLHNLTHNPLVGAVVALTVIVVLWRKFRWGAVSGAFYGVVTHIMLDAIYHYDVARIVAVYGLSAMEDPIPGAAESICLFGFLLWLMMIAVKAIAIGLTKFWRKD